MTTATPTPTPTPTPDIAAAIAHASPSVVRIETTTCEGGHGAGSGFIIAPGYAATAAHVVEGSATIALRSQTDVVGGRVVGMDVNRDLAVVALDAPLADPALDLADELPEIGEEVVVIGYPMGRPLASKVGSVSALDSRVDIPDNPLSGLIETDAAVNPGNSGGPMIDAYGEVVGLVTAMYLDTESQAYAVPTATAGPLLNAWTTATGELVTVDCEGDGDQLVTDKSGHPDAGSLQALFSRYFAMTNKEYSTIAWDMLTGDERRRSGDLETWERTLPYFVTDVTIDSVTFVDAKTDMATLTTTESYYDYDHFGDKSVVCERVSTAYTVRLDSGDWLIDRAESVGEPRTMVCPVDIESDIREAKGSHDSSDADEEEGSEDGASD